MIKCYYPALDEADCYEWKTSRFNPCSFEPETCGYSKTSPARRQQIHDLRDASLELTFNFQDRSIFKASGWVCDDTTHITNPTLLFMPAQSRRHTPIHADDMRQQYNLIYKVDYSGSIPDGGQYQSPAGIYHSSGRDSAEAFFKAILTPTLHALCGINDYQARCVRLSTQSNCSTKNDRSGSKGFQNIFFLMLPTSYLQLQSWHNETSSGASA